MKRLNNDKKFASDNDRKFFVRCLADEMMKTCATKNKPTPLEKTNLARSIVEEFPGLYPAEAVGSGTPHVSLLAHSLFAKHFARKSARQGWIVPEIPSTCLTVSSMDKILNFCPFSFQGHFYDPVSTTEYLENRIRSKRSNDPSIPTQYRPKKPKLSLPEKTRPQDSKTIAERNSYFEFDSRLRSTNLVDEVLLKGSVLVIAGTEYRVGHFLFLRYENDIPPFLGKSLEYLSAIRGTC